MITGILIGILIASFVRFIADCCVWFESMEDKPIHFMWVKKDKESKEEIEKIVLTRVHETFIHEQEN